MWKYQKRIYEYLKKYRYFFYLLLVMLIIHGTQNISGMSEDREDKILSAIAMQGWKEVTVDVEASGYYTFSHLSEDDKCILKNQMQRQLYLSNGIQAQIEIYDQELQSYVGEKYFIYVKIELKNNIQYIRQYRRKLDLLMSRYCKDTQIRMNFCGSLPGKISMQEKKERANKLLKQLQGRRVEWHTGEEVFTMYAYTPWVGECIYLNQEKVNMNYACYYQEQEDKTICMLSTPMIQRDY